MVRLALAAVVALGLAGCNTSYNYFQEEASAEEQDTTAFGAFLTMTGMVPKQREAITHTPRAPLAIPGSTELPDPDAARSAETAVNFPVDQSEREKQRRAALAELAGEDDDLARDGQTRNARLDPGRAQAFRIEGGGRRESGFNVMGDERSIGRRLTREELRKTHRRTNGKGQLLTEDGTPQPRNNLALPPDAYRTPAATAALPDPDDIENSEWVRKRVYKVEDRRPARLQQ